MCWPFGLLCVCCMVVISESLEEDSAREWDSLQAPSIAGINGGDILFDLRVAKLGLPELYGTALV